MINKLIERMFEEAEDYDEYMWLAEETEKEDCKQKLKHIAEQEREHYKTLYDLIFTTEPITDMEKAFKRHAKHIYEHMLEKK